MKKIIDRNNFSSGAYLLQLNPLVRYHNHRLNGLLDFADWELCDAINKLKHFVAYLTNNPPKSSLENGGLLILLFFKILLSFKKHLQICTFSN